MKRILLITVFILSAVQAFSNSFIYLWGGEGISTHNNYNLGMSAGLTYDHALFYRMAFGASVFMQNYNLYYNKEEGGINGVTDRHKSNYAFLSPEFNFHLGKTGRVHVYLTGGVGFNIGCTDTLHKWAAPTALSPGYDSVIDKSANINKMVSRFAFGATEHFYISKHIGMSFTEDFAYLPSLLSTTTEPTDRVFNNNVRQIFRPAYISLRIGFYFKN